MQFTSLFFLIFFPFIVFTYHMIPNKWRNIWLLVINYFFYSCFSFSGAIFLLMVTVITYFAGIAIEKANETKDRKLWNNGILLGGGISCILFLCVMKETVCSFPNMILPIGISFYSLQAIGYLLDIYRGKMPAEKNYLHYFVFLSFFPTIQSGPIEKAQDFLPQLKIAHKFDYDGVKNGLLLMLWGYFEKLAVADMAGVIVNGVYSDYEVYSGWTIVLATIIYAFQLYADFDGYSNIAAGAAQVLGYDLVHNFKYPYFSTSVKEFWQHWHISLSAWLKEYIYIPLGGNRRGNKYMNIIITFAFSGLWHGVGLHYLLWGILHGAYQSAEGIIKKFCKVKRNVTNMFHVLWKFVRMLAVFFVVDFAWLFFRAPDTTTAFCMIEKIYKGLREYNGILSECMKTGITRLQIFFLLFGLICMFIVDVIHIRKGRVRSKIAHFPIVIRWGIYYGVIFILITIMIANMGIDASNFIYEQF